MSARADVCWLAAVYFVLYFDKYISKGFRQQVRVLTELLSDYLSLLFDLDQEAQYFQAASACKC